MLEDVLDATLALSGWETWVISPDEVVLEIALRGARTRSRRTSRRSTNAIRQVEEEAAARDPWSSWRCCSPIRPS